MWPKQIFVVIQFLQSQIDNVIVTWFNYVQLHLPTVESTLN